MATQAQLDEKARKDRAGATRLTFEDFATPAQLAEKAQRDRAGAALSEHATPAQLAEKSRQEEQYSNPSNSFATPAQRAEKPRGRAPPLPPRMPSVQASAPPPYTSDDARRSEVISEQWRSEDPRSSSTHSLVPSESGRDGRRTLLLVFIHGFMGNETSFQSFPAHVHNLLTITLSQTHVVHTKIYPRYKSRKTIDFARDDFSTWLEPHENRNTDVILLGHSMGGLLSAEVALQNPSPATGKPFRHRLLGTINFDTPFLGMHPGVVTLQSPMKVERPLHHFVGSSQSYAQANDSSLSLVQSVTSPLASPPNDPFFNPPFPNDVRLPDRKGWTNVLHFVNKHSDGLTAATKQYFMSHLEFGGSMADYPGLKDRYERIRALEDVDHTPRPGRGHQPPTRRIRFVNYYTASTGRPKEPKIPPGQMLDKDGNLKPIEVGMAELSLKDGKPTPTISTPSISVHVHGEGTVTPQRFEGDPDSSPIEIQMRGIGENSGVQDDVQELGPMQHVDSMPIEDDDEPQSEDQPEIPCPSTEPSLPPVPAMPTEPEAVNLDAYTDKDSRRIAEKELKRTMKAYQQAVKDRESAIRDRKKLVEKREKKARQDREKDQKADERRRVKEERDEEKRKEKQRLEEEKDEEKRKATVNPERGTRQASVASGQDDKRKRDKKFCMLPPEYGGKRDKCWIRVYMEGVDEVGAHCGLFFPGPQYESLVGDVGERISKWVEEDANRGAIIEAMG